MAKNEQQAWIDRAIAALKGEGRRALIEFLQRQRWFGGKGKSLADVRVSDAVGFSDGGAPWLLAFLLVEYRGGVKERYVMPLAVKPKSGLDDATALVEMPESSGQEWLCDATGDAHVWITLYESVARGRASAAQSGCLVGRALPQRLEELAQEVREVKVLSAEQSNTSVILDRRVILKLIRKQDVGVNPDSEMLEFLTAQTTCQDVPALWGLLTYEDGEGEARVQPATVAVIQRFVPNIGDGWTYTLAHLATLLDEGGKAATGPGEELSRAITTMSGSYLKQIRRLGEITGGLHEALASRQEPEAFGPELISARDIEHWKNEMLKHLAEVCQDLRALQPGRQSALRLTEVDVGRLETGCRGRFDDLCLLTQDTVKKIRHHGDYHLGQVLKTTDGFVVIDFEGEPARSLEARRDKVCPLKDVGGMLRSFNYAAHAALTQRGAASSTDFGLVKEWEGAARAAFLDGYRSVAKPGQAVFLPATWEAAVRVIQVYELDKALYELRYEMRNRPDWLMIPLEGIRSLTQEQVG